MKWIASLLYKRIAKEYAADNGLMPPREKANEILTSFINTYSPKENGLKLCDFIIKEVKTADKTEDMPMHVIYWHQVKKEIRRA